MKKSFLLHHDTISVIKELTDEQAGKLIKEIVAYQKNEPVKLTGLMKAIFIPFKNQFLEDDKKSRCGEYHWNWKNGKTSENNRLRNSSEYARWRKKVFYRDNHTCKKCGRIGGSLNAHHIKLWKDHPHLRFKIDNGLTLCKVCHIGVHHG